MASDKNDQIRVMTYMYLWEAYNKSHTLELFEKKYLMGLFASKKIDTHEKNSVIIEVIRDFYEANGIELEKREGVDFFELDKKTINRNDNLFLTFVKRSFELNPLELQEVPNRPDLFFIYKKDLIRLLKEALGGIIFERFLNNCLKLSLKDIFGLGERDVIFFSSDKLFIRYFSKLNSNGAEKRYNGIPKEEFERIVEEMRDFDMKKCVSSATEELLNTPLSPLSMDNITFHKNYLKIIMQNISRRINYKFDSQEMLEGFSGYVLRNYFFTSISIITDFIFENLPKNNENLKNFINFYDGREILVKQKRIRKSTIEAEGQNWNYSSIYNIVSQKQSLKNSFDKKLQEIEKLKQEICKGEQRLVAEKNELLTIDKSLLSINAELNELTQARKEMQEDFVSVQNTIKNGDKREESKSKVEQLREALSTMGKKEDMLIAQKNSISSKKEFQQIKYDQYKKDIETYKRNLAAEETKIENIKSSFLPIAQKELEIKKGLAKAITSFRV